MREVNFSIPTANKASVGITTALYDRRALDCTSTLPLVNSLNHLAYLTTSSARIRDILTVDGGVERLVCILKEGRSRDMMEMWKWNLAFQCVVNIGVRGSEAVRTRVVEADMVPVIATILDNYIKVVDKCREKAEAEIRRTTGRSTPCGTTKSHSKHSARAHSEHPGSSGSRSDRSRRQVPPPIEIPQPYGETPGASERANPLPSFSLSSPPERTTFGRPHQHHHHHRSHEGSTPGFAASASRHIINQPLVTAGPLLETGPDSFGLRPVRDIDRLPSMLPSLQAEASSQPQSPTTPNAPAQLRPQSPHAGRRRRRPSIRHQNSTSGDSDDNNADEIADTPSESVNAGAADEPLVGIQNDIEMQDIVDGESAFEAETTPVRLGPPVTADGGDADAFNIAHRTLIDGSNMNPATPQPATPFGVPALPQNLNLLNAVNSNPPTMNVPMLPWYPRHIAALITDRATAAGIVAAVPRDEDVLMSLQLLAYVSKYCTLRRYFQNSHLVPRLKIGTQLALLDGEAPAHPASLDPSTPEADEAKAEPLAFEDDPDNEYLLPCDLNIFPIVEQFTVRHHSPEMQYWAGVVMRNLCRKDDSRGGIRQCAYWRCGRWEEWTRQFAKCRRCRRTKYCSKECQKAAWGYHRHWCVAAQQ